MSLQNLIRDVQGLKKLLGEFESLAPQLRQAIGHFFNDPTVRSANQEQIRDAINFAVKKVRGDPHVILGVDSDDPIELIKEVYRLKAKYFHPDVKETGNQEKFVKIHEAYKKLGGR